MFTITTAITRCRLADWQQGQITNSEKKQPSDNGHWVDRGQSRWLRCCCCCCCWRCWWWQSDRRKAGGRRRTWERPGEVEEWPTDCVCSRGHRQTIRTQRRRRRRRRRWRFCCYWRWWPTTWNKDADVLPAAASARRRLDATGSCRRRTRWCLRSGRCGGCHQSNGVTEPVQGKY